MKWYLWIKENVHRTPDTRKVLGEASFCFPKTCFLCLVSCKWWSMDKGGSVSRARVRRQNAGLTLIKCPVLLQPKGSCKKKKKYWAEEMGSHVFVPLQKPHSELLCRVQFLWVETAHTVRVESFMNVPFRYLTIVGIINNDQNYYFVTNQNATVKSQRDPITWRRGQCCLNLLIRKQATWLGSGIFQFSA